MRRNHVGTLLELAARIVVGRAIEKIENGSCEKARELAKPPVHVKIAQHNDRQSVVWVQLVRGVSGDGSALPPVLVNENDNACNQRGEGA